MHEDEKTRSSGELVRVGPSALATVEAFRRELASVDRLGWWGEEMPVGVRRVEAGEHAGKRRYWCASPTGAPVELLMVYVPPGEFWRGSDDGAPQERPRHRCRLTRGFYAGVYPVTWGEYERVARAERPEFPVTDRHPVVNVRWEDAQGWCGATGFRLLTEAEWEYLARGKDGRAYPWGNEAPTDERPLLDRVWWSPRGFQAAGGTRAVGEGPAGASPWGAEDMAGNVLEWVEDVYDAEAYRAVGASIAVDPWVRSTGSVDQRVRRGGGWLRVDPSWVRAPVRSRPAPSHRVNNVGFRCARGIT